MSATNEFEILFKAMQDLEKRNKAARAVLLHSVQQIEGGVAALMLIAPALLDALPLDEQTAAIAKLHIGKEQLPENTSQAFRDGYDRAIADLSARVRGPR